jgi:hypothetical protein
METWEAVYQLCTRDYWKRLWIIQEVVLAPQIQIYCGEETFPWDIFQYVREKLLAQNKFRMRWNHKHPLAFHHYIPAKLSQHRHCGIFASANAPTLIELYTLFEGALCKDPRDKIFGLLSLSMECCKEYTPADYSKTAFDVFNNAFFHHSQCHMTGFNYRKHDADIMMLRYRARFACVDSPKPLNNYLSTILYTGP